MNCYICNKEISSPIMNQAYYNNVPDLVCEECYSIKKFLGEKKNTFRSNNLTIEFKNNSREKKNKQFIQETGI